MSENTHAEAILNDYLRYSFTSEAITEMLNARDQFLIASSKFLVQRILLITAGGSAQSGPSTEVVPFGETTIFQVPSQPAFVYERIFARVPHIKNRCAIARHAQFANAVHAVAALKDCEAKSLRDGELEGDLVRGEPRTFCRDFNLEGLRGHSPFITFLEAFVQLATSCKEGKDRSHWDCFCIAILGANEAKMAVLLESAILYLETAYDISNGISRGFDSCAAEYETFMNLLTALLELLGTLPNDVRLAPHEDVVAQYIELYSIVQNYNSTPDVQGEIEKYTVWYKNAHADTKANIGGARRCCADSLQKIIRLHDGFLEIDVSSKEPTPDVDDIAGIFVSDDMLVPKGTSMTASTIASTPAQHPSSSSGDSSDWNLPDTGSICVALSSPSAEELAGSKTSS